MGKELKTAELIQELLKTFEELNSQSSETFQNIVKLREKFRNINGKIVDMNHTQLKEPVDFYYLRVNILPFLFDITEITMKQTFTIGRTLQKFSEFINIITGQAGLDLSYKVKFEPDFILTPPYLIGTTIQWLKDNNKEKELIRLTFEDLKLAIETIYANFLSSVEIKRTNQITQIANLLLDKIQELEAKKE